MTEKLDKGEPYQSLSPFHSELWWSSGGEKEEKEVQCGCNGGTGRVTQTWRWR